MNTLGLDKESFFYVLHHRQKDKLMHVSYKEVQEVLYYGTMEIPDKQRYAQYIQQLRSNTRNTERKTTKHADKQKASAMINTQFTTLLEGGIDPMTLYDIQQYFIRRNTQYFILYDPTQTNVFLKAPSEVYDAIRHKNHRLVDVQNMKRRVKRYAKLIREGEENYDNFEYLERKLHRSVIFCELFDMQYHNEQLQQLFYRFFYVKRNYTDMLRRDYIRWIDIGNVINRRTSGPYYDSNELVYHYVNSHFIIGNGEDALYERLRGYVYSRQRHLIELDEMIIERLRDFYEDMLMLNKKYIVHSKSFAQEKQLVNMIKYYTFFGYKFINMMLRGNSVFHQYFRVQRLASLIKHHIMVLLKIKGFKARTKSKAHVNNNISDMHNKAKYFYRYIDDSAFLKGLQPNQQYTSPQFLSLSRNPFFQSSSYSLGNTLLVIKIKEEDAPLNIENYSLFPYEKECLMAPASFKLIKKSSNVDYLNPNLKGRRQLRSVYVFEFLKYESDRQVLERVGYEKLTHEEDLEQQMFRFDVGVIDRSNKNFVLSYNVAREKSLLRLSNKDTDIDVRSNDNTIIDLYATVTRDGNIPLIAEIINKKLIFINYHLTLTGFSDLDLEQHHIQHHVKVLRAKYKSIDNVIVFSPAYSLMDSRVSPWPEHEKKEREILAKEKRNRLVARFTDCVVLNRTTEQLVDIIVDDTREGLDSMFISNNSICMERLKRIVYKLRSIKFQNIFEKGSILYKIYDKQFQRGEAQTQNNFLYFYVYIREHFTIYMPYLQHLLTQHLRLSLDIFKTNYAFYDADMKIINVFNQAQLKLQAGIDDFVGAFQPKRNWHSFN